jgi:hypothetical protein
MHAPTNPFAELVTRMKHGDQAARLHLRQQMAHNLLHIVRRSIRTGSAASPLDRRILAEAQRVRTELVREVASDPEQLIRIVAHNLCSAMMTNLQPAGDAVAGDETVAQASASTW